MSAAQPNRTAASAAELVEQDGALAAPLELGCYIDGMWRQPTSTERQELRSPMDGAPIGWVSLPSAADIAEAARAARRAQAAWAKVSPFERAQCAHRIGDAISARAEALARLQSLEQGKPLGESRADVEEAATLFHLHAEDLMRLGGETLPVRDPAKRMLTFRRPVGTWGIITPWNFPVLMMAEFVAPGLVTGNSLVVKPPAHTAAAVLATVEAFEEAGVPPGLFNVCPGDGRTGAMLVDEPGFDAFGFIGSSATGEQIQARAGLRRTIMECSGNGPLIVCKDADVERAALAATYGATLCSGQVCCATERVLVDAAVHDRFVEACLSAAKDVRLGRPFEPSTTLGPLNNEGVAAKMDRHILDATDRGASVLVGGGRRAELGSPLYYDYTVLDGVTTEMAVAREESFGPVLPILSAASDDELIVLANADALGLQAAVFTRDLGRAFRYVEELQVGQVIVNDTTDYWDVSMPFGGAGGRRTGWGRIGGKWTLMDMTDLRTAVFDLT